MAIQTLANVMSSIKKSKIQYSYRVKGFISIFITSFSLLKNSQQLSSFLSETIRSLQSNNFMNWKEANFTKGIQRLFTWLWKGNECLKETENSLKQESYQLCWNSYQILRIGASSISSRVVKLDCDQWYWLFSTGRENKSIVSSV